MGQSLLLDTVNWDLVVDAFGNIAVASAPYSTAQDVACAIKTFLGECYFDTAVGMPWQQILGQRPSLAILKAVLVATAEAVTGVASATVFISSVANRNISGQVQVTTTSGQTQAASFTVAMPQGAG